MYFLGLDLGQKRDYSAVVVVARVREMVMSDALYGDCCLAVDATGVGAPVVDMLRAARLGCAMTAVTITGGEKGSGSMWSGNASVPKRDLMTELLVLLEKGMLTIGATRESGQLVRELKDVKASMNGRGQVRMGADGNGEHDDLAIALALACWRARRKGTCGEMGKRLL